MNYDLDKFGLSEEELFSPVDNSSLESEKITAPRYSYWHSVFRVFFKKKINIAVLCLLGVILLMTYVYPLFVEYDRFANLMNGATKHLSPGKALQQLGFNIHWILGSGASGQSTFDAVWFGSRISVSLAFICALINLSIGVIVGSVWGFSKKVDVFMMEVYNIIGNIPYVLLISHILVIFLACIDIQAGKDAADVIQTGKNVIQRFCTFFHCSLFCAERFYFLRKLLLCFLKFFITTKQTRKIPAVRRIHLFSFFQFNFCHISPFIHLFRRNHFCGFSSNTNVPHLRLVYHNLTSKSKIFS